MLIVGGEFIHANIDGDLVGECMYENDGDGEVIIVCVNICIESSHMFMHS